MPEICEYEKQYKEKLIRMILKIQQEEYRIPITAEDQPDLADIESFYLLNGGNFWLALQDGDVIGTVAVKNIGNGNTALRKMFVQKEFRGKDAGISQALLNQLKNWVKEKGYRKIYLGTTPQFLAAHRFYEKNGFDEIDKNKLPAEFPVMEVDKKFYCFEVLKY